MSDAKLPAIREATARPPQRVELEGARRAAVAVVFTPELDVLLMRRAQRDGDPWSGHISLPGGHEEPEDADLVRTAMRETHEELGLALGPPHHLGFLDPIPTRPGLPPRVIHPFVFHVDRPPTLSPNREVASLHRLSLDDLLSGRGRGSFPLQHGGSEWTLPRVDFDGVRLWGLTLMILDDLLHRIDGRGIGLERPTLGDTP